MKIISKFTKLYIIIAAIIAILLLTIIAIYWFYNSKYISTDDAYVNAHVVQVACRVSGQIAHLNVANNQFVKKGQLLFALDRAPFVLAADKARAQLAVAQAQLHNIQLNTKRTLTLVNIKVLPAQKGDTATADLKTAVANLALAKSNLMQAMLDLGYTRVYAATDGWIASLTIREGDIVAANQALFALISNNQYWIDANFKETELARIHPGQRAKVVVDMYPDHIFSGVVDSVSGGTGTAFSLLPPQNAIGNWVKVTQRVPVKIRVLNPDATYPLRIGSTATVTVDIH